MGKKIIIVEDDFVVSTNLQMTLEELEYQVLLVTDAAEEALNAIPKLKPDLLLLDIDLAGPMDGIQLAEAIHAQHHLPFIFLTSHADIATIERAKTAKPAAYLVKPFNEGTLLSSIELALYQHNQAETDGSTRVDKKKNDIYLMNDSFFVKNRNRLEKLALKNILWIEASDIYAIIVTENTKYIVNYALKVLANKFSEDDFMRIHRSYIVNMHKITALEDGHVVINEQYIPIGKTYRNKIMERLRIM